MEWQYERGEGRHKHRWKWDYPGFEPSEKGSVGKCPKSITKSKAQEILNQGIPWYDDDDDEVPARIYCLHEGVVYEAVPTRPGVSWHGYPWRGDLPGKTPLPARIQRKLKEMAEATGCAQEFRKWMKNYS